MFSVGRFFVFFLVVIGLMAGRVSVASAVAAPAKAPAPPKPAAAPKPADFGPDAAKSADVAVDGWGDAAGYHVEVGRESSGFAWREVALLHPAGVDDESWTGYQCLSGDGRFAAVAILPASAVNQQAARDHGAFAYSVDLGSGVVHPVALGVGLKYFSPGCGGGDEAVFTAGVGNSDENTALLTADLMSGRVAESVTASGQVTSAVPTAAGVVGVQGGHVVAISAQGKAKPVAAVAGDAYELRPSADGGVTFLVVKPGEHVASAVHEQAGTLTTLGSGDLTRLQLFQGRAGHAVLSGASSSTSDLLAAAKVSLVSDRGLARGAASSSLDGDALVGSDSDGQQTRPAVLATKTGRVFSSPVPAGGATPNTAVPTYRVPGSIGGPATVQSGTLRPKADAALAAPQATPNTAQTPTCAVPRLDPAKQVMQPAPAQVDWAVQLAEQGLLTGSAYTRPAGFDNLGLVAYAPNSDFPLITLSHPSGDGWDTVPRSVFEAIMAQESNWSQASWHAPKGVAGDPLIADYYGAAGGITSINYGGADCGYGISQVTTGMRVGDSSLSAHGQIKVAVDYQENIAAGLQILETTWNQLYADGILANNGDPRYLENWYYAAWAYNSGIQPTGSYNTTGCTPGPSCTGPDGTWGLGWTNNPDNLDYPPNRDPYLQDTYADAAHPGSWPYQERVMGWMASPLLRYGAHAYAKPTYNGGGTWLQIPAFASFCDLTANQCDPNNTNQSNPGASHCMLNDFECWWHQPVTWVPDCSTSCATSAYAFGSGSTEPGNPDPDPPTCQLDTSKVPGNAVIVDDQPSPPLNIQGCAGENWSSNGSFTYAYGTNSAGDPIGAIDTHQLGTGLGGHILFSHTETGSDPTLINTGTWTPNLPSLQYYKIKLHIPGLGAEATNVVYTINPGGGVAPWKIRVNQAWNSEQWVTIGTFAMENGGTVALSNQSSVVGSGNVDYSYYDVAFDAVAFVPMGGTPGQPIGGPPGIIDAPKGSNPAWVNCGCVARTAGDPIDTATGYFGETFTDLATPGRGEALDFTRTYTESIADPNGPNGSVAAEGPFGWGWTDSYNLSTSTDSASGNVIVHQEDGSEVTFVDTGGTYAPSAPRYDATLVKTGSNYVYTRRGNDIFTFDSATGHLTGETDLAGSKANPAYQTTLAYDGNGHLSTVTDPAGRAYTLTWTGNHITGLADTAGRQVSYAYDTSGDLTDVYGVGSTRTPSLKDDDHTQFTYNGTHLMTSMRSPTNFGGPSSAVTAMAYDSAERVTTQTDAAGHATTFTYGPDGGLTAGQTLVTDPSGHKTLDTYQNGLLVSETKGYGTADAGTWSYTYDPVTLGVSTETDPDGNLQTFTYDDHGNKTSESNGLGYTTNYAYDDTDHLAETIDPNGVATVNQYDQAANIPSGAAGAGDLTSTTVTQANNIVESTTGNFGPAPTRTTSYGYDDAAHPGDRTRSVDPNGQTTTTGYDSFGDKTSATDPAGDKTQYGYNTGTGWLTSTVDPNGKTTTYAQDPWGNVIQTTDPLEKVTAATYDADGNKTSTTDANNHTTTSTFNTVDQLVKVTHADATTQVTDYNSDGTVADTIDGNNAKTSYGYDGQDRKTSRTDPDNRATTSHLDPAGHLLTTTDAAGGVTTLGYDAAGETISVSYSDGATPNTVFGYDPDGHRVSMADGTGTSTWIYDTFGEVTGHTQGSGTTVSYGYDPDGNQTSISYPGQTTPVSRTFDTADRLSTVTDWNGNKTTFGYDADNNVLTTAYPNGTTLTNGYDVRDTLTSSTAVTGSTSVLSVSYGRDPVGQVSSQTLAGATQNYGYTPREQLASTSDSSFGYDPAGNPTTLGSATQTFDAAGQLCWSLPSGTVSNPACSSVANGATTYTFNALGQRTKAGATTYGYDQAGRLTSFAGPNGSATYGYDGMGLRTSKTVGSTTSTFVWDDGPTPNVLTDGTNSYLYDPDGLPLEQIGAAGSFWFVHDQVGSTLALLNANGNAVGTYTYTPYGVATHSGATATPLQYTGQYTDAESGQVYLRARYYDPSTAQFLTVDPQVDQTGTPYAYTGDNPLNYTDLMGLCWSGFGWACAAASAVSHAATAAANFVWQNRSWFEVGLGVASLAIPFLGAAAWIGIAGDSAFWAGTALTAADTAVACAHWSTKSDSCATGAASLATGGAGYAFDRAGHALAGVAKQATGLGRGLARAGRVFASGAKWAHNLSSLGYSVTGACGGGILRSGGDSNDLGGR
jgi:RHS repeat-associated protein